MVSDLEVLTRMGVAPDWAPGQPAVTLPLVWLVHAATEHGPPD